MKTTAVQIGWFTLPSPTVFKKEFETASWYEMVEVPAGKYPVMAREQEDGKIVDDSIDVTLTGTVKESYFENRLLWAVSAKVNTTVGQTAVVGRRPYAHALAWEILNNATVGAGEWELDGYEAVRVPFVYSRRDGTEETGETANIFRIGGK